MHGLARLIKLFFRIDQKLAEIITIMNIQAVHLQNYSQPPSIWLDNQDVMQKLKISESTLRRRRLEGTIRSTRIKGKYYYKESDIQEVLGREWDQR
jgi:hypothetical protein